MTVLRRLVLVALALTSHASLAGERVVTLAPHLAELVHAVGAGDQLVGVSRFADYPPSVRDLPAVGDAFSLNAEQLVTLAPTLVLVWDGGTPTAMRERLAALDMPVLAVTIRRLDDIPQAMRTLGQRLGVSGTADAAAAAFSADMTALQVTREPPVRVFYQVSASPVYTLNNDHVASDVIRLCGGVNVFGDMETIAPQLSKEAVILAKPEAIISTSADGHGIWRDKTVIPAVANGHVWAVNADWLTRPGPRLVVGARAVCHHLDAVRPAIAPRRDSPAGTNGGR